MIGRTKTRLQQAATTLVAVCSVTSPSLGQHSDVFISVTDNQIVVQNQSYPDTIRSFDVLGDGTVWHGTNPGYSTTGANQFRLNDQVEFNVVSPLLFSSGQEWMFPDVDNYVRQFWPVFPQLSVTMTAQTGNQPGFLIASVGSRGTLHQHHTFELSSFSGAAPPIGAYAFQQVIHAEGYATSDPYWIVLNNGLPITEFASTLRLLPSIGTVGDFDRNGILDSSDINRIQEQLRTSMTPTEFTREFDLTGDALIDREDLEYWVRNIRQTWIGDANLDGRFNSSDLIQVFAFGQYNDNVPNNSTWEQGDWNGDSEFDSGDVIAAFQDGGYEQGQRVMLVPEPQSSSIAILAGTVLLWCRRSISKRQ